MRYQPVICLLVVSKTSYFSNIFCQSNYLMAITVFVIIPDVQNDAFRHLKRWWHYCHKSMVADVPTMSEETNSLFVEYLICSTNIA
jgi:hypothetical protein